MTTTGQLTIVEFPADPACEQPVTALHAKRDRWGEHNGPTTYGCFSRVQLGRAVEAVLAEEGERLGPGRYWFGWCIADIVAHSCSCGNLAACWHLAAALLAESGLRPLPDVVEAEQRWRETRYAEVKARLAEDPCAAQRARELRDEGRSAQEIGALFGVSQEVVGRWLAEDAT